MVRSQFRNSLAPRKQDGTILLVAIVLLLVMTLVGVATLESSTLQERMASNDRQQTIAQNAAEFALRSGEQWILDNIQSTGNLQLFNGNVGLYSAVPRPNGIGGAIPLPNAIDVANPDDWNGLGVQVAGLEDDIVAQDPRYIIEYIGRVGPPSAIAIQRGEGTGQGLVDPFFFRITAIGWSRNLNIFRVLESSVSTGNGDGVFTY